MPFWALTLFTLVAVALAAGCWRAARGRLFRFVLIALIGLWWRDVVLSPMSSGLVGYVEPTAAGQAEPEELLRAAWMVTATYASIAVAFAASYLVARRAFATGSPEGARSVNPRRGFAIAAAVFGAGLVGSLTSVALLLPHYSLSEIASTRAVFSATEVIDTKAFLYSRVAATIMPIGTTMMLLLAGRSRGPLVAAVAAVSSVVVIQVIFGGRSGAIHAAVLPLLAFHFGVRPLRPREVAVGAAAVVIGLLAIQGTRLAAESPLDGAKGLGRDLVATGALNQAAWVVRITSATEGPYMLEERLGLETQAGAITHFFPTAHWPEWRNTWIRVRDDYLRKNSIPGFLVRGNSGQHYVPAAEAYLAAGWTAVSWLPAVFAAIHGLVIGLALRSPGRLGVALAVFSATALLLTAFGGKMAAGIGGMSMAAILPIGAVALFAGKRRRLQAAYVGAVALFGILFLMDRFISDSAIRGVMMAVLMGFMYVAGMAALFDLRIPSLRAFKREKRPDAAPAAV